MDAQKYGKWALRDQPGATESSCSQAQDEQLRDTTPGQKLHLEPRPGYMNSIDARPILLFFAKINVEFF